MDNLIDPEFVGRRIREIRKELGLSMTAFAEKIDNKAKSGTVSNWETGKNLPNNERLKRIAKLGNISIDELLYGDIETRIYRIILTEIEKNPKNTEKPHYYIFHVDEEQGNEIIKDAMPELKYRALSSDWSNEEIAAAFDEIAIKEFLRRPYTNRHAIVYTNILLTELSNDVASFFYRKNLSNEYVVRSGLSEDLYNTLLSEIEETTRRISNYLAEFPDDNLGPF